MSEARVFQLEPLEVETLRNIFLQKQLFEMQLQIAKDKAAQKQNEVEKAISTRLGVSILGGGIDLDNGTLSLPSQETHPQVSAE